MSATDRVTDAAARPGRPARPARSGRSGRPGRQRAGFVLAGLLLLVNLPSAWTPSPDGEVGPPLSIMIGCTALAVVGLGSLVLAWRSGHRVAVRVLAACLLLLALASLPALFVDVPALLKTAVALSLVLTVAALVLVFSGTEEPAP